MIELWQRHDDGELYLRREGSEAAASIGQPPDPVPAGHDFLAEAEKMTADEDYRPSGGNPLACDVSFAELEPSGCRRIALWTGDDIISFVVRPYDLGWKTLAFLGFTSNRLAGALNAGQTSIGYGIGGRRLHFRGLLLEVEPDEYAKSLALSMGFSANATQLLGDSTGAHWLVARIPGGLPFGVWFDGGVWRGAANDELQEAILRIRRPGTLREGALREADEFWSRTGPNWSAESPEQRGYFLNYPLADRGRFHDCFRHGWLAARGFDL